MEDFCRRAGTVCAACERVPLKQPALEQVDSALQRGRIVDAAVHASGRRTDRRRCRRGLEGRRTNHAGHQLQRCIGILGKHIQGQLRLLVSERHRVLRLHVGERGAEHLLRRACRAAPQRRRHRFGGPGIPVAAADADVGINGDQGCAPVKRNIGDETVVEHQLQVGGGRTLERRRRQLHRFRMRVVLGHCR